MRKTCSSSAFISLSCTNWKQNIQRKKKKFRDLNINWLMIFWGFPTLCTHAWVRVCVRETITLRTGGFMMKFSNGSSGRTVVKFSCKMVIFFSLSHPDGLQTHQFHQNPIKSIVPYFFFLFEYVNLIGAELHKILVYEVTKYVVTGPITSDM